MTIDRRSFLSVLASLPVIGRLFAAPTLPVRVYEFGDEWIAATSLDEAVLHFRSLNFFTAEEYDKWLADLVIIEVSEHRMQNLPFTDEHAGRTMTFAQRFKEDQAAGPRAPYYFAGPL